MSQAGVGANGITAISTETTSAARNTMSLRPTRSPTAPQNGPASAAAKGPAAKIKPAHMLTSPSSSIPKRCSMYRGRVGKTAINPIDTTNRLGQTTSQLRARIGAFVVLLAVPVTGARN